MINPKWLESIPDAIVDIWAEAEEAALVDAARMIKKYGVTATTQHTMQTLRASGNTQKSINKSLSGVLGKSEKEVSSIILKAGNAVVQGDTATYKAAGLYKTTDVDKDALNHVLRQGTQSTLQNLRNIIRATAQNGSKQVYDAIDTAQLLVSSGLYSQDKAVESAIKTLADHGLDSVTYTDGHGHVTQKASIETAVRRAVQTGVNQTALKICDELADEVGCDLVEVSAHEGARPSHALWQGKIYSRSGKSDKYPKLSTATGYGTITGLGGVNCRHTFGPWVEGSNTVWSDKELEDLQKPKIMYNGKMYTEYEASQIQRKMERTIRKWKRQEAMCKATDIDSTEASAKVKEWQDRQTNFIKQTGMRRDYSRENIYISNKSTKQVALTGSLSDNTAKGISGKTADEYKKMVDATQTRIDTMEAKAHNLKVQIFESESSDEKTALRKERAELQDKISNMYSEKAEFERKYNMAKDQQQMSTFYEKFGAIKGKHSVVDDIKHVNPNYGKKETGTAFSANCPSCALAYDARRRGINATAIAMGNGQMDYVWKSYWTGLKMEHVDSSIQAVSEKAMSYGKGTRGIIKGTWGTDPNSGGHVFNYEITETGELLFIDSQCGSTDITYYFNGLHNVQIGRTDDLPLSKNALDALQGAE